MIVATIDRMLNVPIQAAVATTGAPLASTLVTVDGSLATAVASAVFVLGGVLLSVVRRRPSASA